MSKTQPQGMPSQCIDTGEALLKVYGKEKTVKFIQGNIDSLKEAYGLLPKDQVTLRLKLALQSDFWAQTLESISPTYAKD